MAGRMCEDRRLHYQPAAGHSVSGVLQLPPVNGANQIPKSVLESTLTVVLAKQPEN